MTDSGTRTNQKGKGSEMNFTRNEVITLASILINETNKEDEYPRIAGVYINRLNKGIKLAGRSYSKICIG